MLLALVLLPLVVAALAPLLTRWLGGWSGIVLAAVPLAGLTWVLGQLEALPAAPTLVLPWAPSLGVNFALQLDGLAATFCVLITGIGALVLIYAGGYFGNDPRLGRLNAYLLMFMSAMLGVVLADDLMSLFIFWELTSITSYLLIGFNHQHPAARDSALRALLVTGVGGLALLAGLVLLFLMMLSLGVPAEQAGRLSTLLDHADGLRSHALYPAALILILLGAFTKSAQFPFHFWLPGAMAAPTPVSAYLHSATMVKAGVYLLARLQPSLGHTLLWEVTVTTVGAVTMVTAAALALGQHDLKRILAFTTVSVLGTLTMLLGPGTDLTIKAAVAFLFAHALYKAALFLVAGNVDHETGTRDITRLSGLGRLMPLTAAAGGLAALSMAGAPPMFGFISKELLLKAKLDLEHVGVYLILAAVLANIFMIALALVVAVRPFFGARQETPKHPHEAPLGMLVGPLALAVLGFASGLVPQTFDDWLGTPTATAIAGYPLEMKLKLWHGLNPVALTALGISAVTLTVGFLLFLKFGAWFGNFVAWRQRLEPWGAERGYDRSYAGLLSGAAMVTRRLQSGYLRRYLLITLLATLSLLIYPLTVLWSTLEPQAWKWNLRWHEPLLAAFVLGGALFTVRTHSRLGAVAALGVTGMAVALIFAMFGAADLAITQIMVETLTVILFVYVFYHLPALRAQEFRGNRLRNAIIALLGGGTVTLLILASASVAGDPIVSNWLAANSVPRAYGRNVVNVILVDYRALDTFGEIIVVAVAGVGVLALLRLRARRREATG